jgi:hypothetical protein
MNTEVERIRAINAKKKHGHIEAVSHVAFLLDRVAELERENERLVAALQAVREFAKDYQPVVYRLAEAALRKPPEGAKDEHGFWPHCGCDTHAQHLDRVKEKPTGGAIYKAKGRT